MWKELARSSQRQALEPRGLITKESFSIVHQLGRGDLPVYSSEHLVKATGTNFRPYDICCTKIT